MKPVVIDNSIVLAWCLADEFSAVADQAMEHVVEHGGIVPGIWWYELRNALVVNERRGRLSTQDTDAILTDFNDLNITIDHDHDEAATLELARQQTLTVYDAAYLELAKRKTLTLATLDDKLHDAAMRSGVAIYGK